MQTLETPTEATGSPSEGTDQIWGLFSFRRPPLTPPGLRFCQKTPSVRSIPSRLLPSVSLRPDRIAPIDRGPVSSSSVLLFPPDHLLPLLPPASSHVYQRGPAASTRAAAHGAALRHGASGRPRRHGVGTYIIGNRRQLQQPRCSRDSKPPVRHGAAICHGAGGRPRRELRRW